MKFHKNSFSKYALPHLLKYDNYKEKHTVTMAIIQCSTFP